MRAKLNLLSALAVGIVGGVLVSACQTYDFEPVEPLALAQTTVGDVITAKALKPNMMVLLDISGSMTLPVNSEDPDCKDPSGTPPNDLCGQPGNVNCDVSRCPTRWSELRSAMATFLTSSGSIARMGLTTYPASTGTTATQCLASSSVRIPVPQVEDTDTTALQNAASQISNEILNKPINGQGGPSGGTPTSESLKFVGQQTDLQGTDRDDFVLLLTDGLPNCNAANPNAGNQTTCRCTQTSCGSSPLGCLDKDASVAAVAELQSQKQIRTIVIGFGAETAVGAGPETLNAMAEAGGFARNCAKDANACGAGDTCDPVSKVCGRRFYQAANQAELATALAEIINKVGTTDPCLLALDPSQLPSDRSLIVVYVNDQAVDEGTNTWQLTDLGVQFVGDTCTRILNSTDANPIKLEARAVQRK
ncbi:adventurous gliding motility lipoprotein CglB [Hyalangium sp.]|uniref:adventurous gliding motility lipoprotein CglB n=1 Tax=Hyalangium sp. TaxID=2028555 RepID=UPI002D4A2B06|nr:adventurous gliding motility lipoprotein CglB [Hyalangium sp.]HYI00720.1 adventurous gliding motility lipoprotein CglB [Hyalangium sp.]